MFDGSNLWSDTTLAIVSNVWTVPAGILFLFLYGRLHFNTPTYPLELLAQSTGTLGDKARLPTQAPPMFTTQRSRYNSYSLRYIAILEIAFIIIVFGATVLRDIGRADGLTLPDFSKDLLQYRSIWALFLLTGLLSSFPGLKNIDLWLLTNLHRAALIPDDVRHYASTLFQAGYIPPQSASANVRATLAFRDTTKVADNQIYGRLEHRILDILCFRFQIQTILMREDRYKRVSTKFSEDYSSLSTQAQKLRNEIVIYLKDQEKLLPASGYNDIDIFIDSNTDRDNIKELSDRRNELLTKCDTAYELLCLFVALALFATTSGPEALAQEAKRLGFIIEPTPIPTLDWDAVLKVSSAAVLIMLSFNLSFELAFSRSGLFKFAPNLEPSRQSTLRFAILFFVAYTTITWIAIQLKRRWRRKSKVSENHENILVAGWAYVSTVWINIVINFYMTGGNPTYAPLLFGLNQAVFGYFMGLYLDRVADNKNISFRLALYQGAAQAVAMCLATSLSPSLLSGDSASEALRMSISIGAFSMLQAAVSWFVVGLLFQYTYCRQSDAILSPASRPPTVMILCRTPLEQ